MIDLVPIYSNSVSEIDLSGSYNISSNYFNNSKVYELSEINVSSRVIKKIENDIYIIIKATGKMLIDDSISLDRVWYPFSIEINEKIDDFIENDKNSLDIIEVLWQNIVLEVPLRYTEVKDYSSYQGDGWKLVSEEELVNNNPFNTLLKDEDRSD